MTAEQEIDFVRGSLDHCVKCTICETQCPVAAVTPLFPGPKYVGPQAERFRGAGESVDASLDYCSSCGMCTLACPQGVQVAEINSRARAVMKQQHGISLRDQLIARPPLQGKLGTPVAPLANFVLSNRFARLVAEKTLGIHRDAPVPKFAGRTFRSWARRQPAPADTYTRPLHAALPIPPSPRWPRPCCPPAAPGWRRAQLRKVRPANLG